MYVTVKSSENKKKENKNKKEHHGEFILNLLK